MQPTTSLGARRSPLIAGILGLAALLCLLVAGTGAADATTAAATTSCPSFKVLHNDRIGPAGFPAGNYTIAIPSAANLSCKQTGELFARFLDDYDGVLPAPWKVVAEGSGKAGFNRNGRLGFSVKYTSSGGGEGGTNRFDGRLCPGTFTVNATTVVGPLRFTKGKFLIYRPAGTGISCNRASVLFTRFLAIPDGTLPPPWRLQDQTATFYKTTNPTRSAFRIEPLDGSGVR